MSTVNQIRWYLETTERLFSTLVHKNVGTHYNGLGELILMCTHSICFYGELKKIISYHQIPTVFVSHGLNNNTVTLINRIWAAFWQNLTKWPLRPAKTQIRLGIHLGICPIWPLHPAKTQIRLGIHPVWSESSLCTHWVVKDPMFLHVDNEDSDQTGRMPRLIWVFADCTGHFVGFVMRRLNYIPCS